MNTSIHSLTLLRRPASTAPAATTPEADPDLSLALGMLLLGATGALTATFYQPHPFSMEAGMDGCLVVGLVAMLLAMVEGLRWRKAVAVLTPVFAVQVVACYRYRVSPIAVMGLEAMIVGALGALSELVRRRRAIASPTPATRRGR